MQQLEQDMSNIKENYLLAGRFLIKDTLEVNRDRKLNEILN